MKTPKLLPALLAVAVAVAGSPTVGLAQFSQSPAARMPDVVYVPTPNDVVAAMLKLAAVKPGEMVYDLGCGDGRIVITAAKEFGARGVGVDIDPRRIEESEENAREAGVTDRVQFKQADLFTMDFADADVVSLYLLPALNVRLRPRLLDELRPGTRIVSHAFNMADWEPDAKELVGTPTKTIFHWVIPAKVAGNWNLELPDGGRATLALDQEFQKVKGTLRRGGQDLIITDGRLKGRTLTFTFGPGNAAQFSGEVEGDSLQAQVREGSGTQNWSGRR